MEAKILEIRGCFVEDTEHVSGLVSMSHCLKVFSPFNVSILLESVWTAEQNPNIKNMNQGYERMACATAVKEKQPEAMYPEQILETSYC